MTESAPQPADGPNLSRILIEVMARVTEFLEVERSTLFLYDEEKQELWTPVAQGTGEIRLPRGSGIAGHVFETGETVRLADAHTDPRFNQEIDRRTGYRTRDLYCRPVLDSGGRRLGVIQLINRRDEPLTPRDEALLDAICSQAGIAIENAQLYLRLSRVRDSERALHARLEANHAELRKAFLKVEESAAAQEMLSRRVQQVRFTALVAVIGLFVAVGLFAWRGGGGSRPMAGADPAATEVVWHAVGAGPVRTGVVLLGNLEPLEIRNLTSPLRGRIAEKNFAYGELVENGQLLARIDTTDVEVELRNAEAAHFRALADLRRLESWETGPEVARARRTLLRARLNFEANQRNLAEMEQLSELGIIAQSSLESARQQFVLQETEFRSAQDELDNVLADATEERITIARHDVTNTQLRMTELRDRISRAVLHAPFDGIVILPNARPTAGRPAGSDGFFEVGSTIAQNEILLALGNLEGVSVKTRADEVEIGRIRHGQAVRITGDAFPGLVLPGRVEYVSSQAIATGARPYFEIVVKTGRLSPEEMAAVRLGMTAKLDITVYESTSSLVVPVAAVRREGGEAFVFRSTPGGDPERVAVKTGATTPGAIEIVEGLTAGDLIAADARMVLP